MKESFAQNATAQKITRTNSNFKQKPNEKNLWQNI